RLQEEELNKRLEENELNKRLEENELNKRLEKEELKKKSEKNKVRTRAERDALNKKLEEDELNKRLQEEELNKRLKREEIKKKLEETKREKDAINKNLDKIKKRLEEVRAKQEIEENNTYNSLSGAEQVVKDKLCEIVHLYDGICKNIGADKAEWFMKHVGFIKTVTECLDRPVLFFENKPTSLSEIIDHLFYPEERVAYPWDAINVHSVRLDIPPELRKSDDLLNILFTYVKKKIFPLTYITICNSAPSSNFKFTEFDCFTRVREVTLIDVSLHSNTFKD
ncbi:hypothetical protein NEMIN01_2516, partial [Nematocida minor]|uniref:uncharacterized protein n=1 Tax=Nematocida minor TaxID=1912983 RepID=UPI00221FC574